jgi:hypothetical protein
VETLQRTLLEESEAEVLEEVLIVLHSLHGRPGLSTKL